MANARVYVSKGALETKKFARRFARGLFVKKSRSKNALIVALDGELGSGKTMFIQGFARGLGLRGKIKSPTFVLMRQFSLSREAFPYRRLIHIDAYRIKRAREIQQLGWDLVRNDPRTIVVIEWASNIRKILKKPYVQISFSHVSKNKNERRILVQWNNKKNKKH